MLDVGFVAGNCCLPGTGYRSLTLVQFSFAVRTASFLKLMKPRSDVEWRQKRRKTPLLSCVFHPTTMEFVLRAESEERNVCVCVSHISNAARTTTCSTLSHLKSQGSLHPAQTQN